MKCFGLVVLFVLKQGIFANTPGEAAIEFLEKVRAGKLSLEPGQDTALRADTVESKLVEIRRGIAKLGEDVQGGRLEIGEVRVEADFAVVMVEKVHDFQEGQCQVFPVALVRRGEEWLAGPVVGSFENAVVGYTIAVRQRIGGLEKWMSRERVVALDGLLEKAMGRTVAMIRERIDPEELKGERVGEIAERFMKACREGDQGALLGFFGGLSVPLPGDWAARVDASEGIVAGVKMPTERWRLFTAPEVVRVILKEEHAGGVGVVWIGCVDPARAGKKGTVGVVEVIQLGFSKDEGGRWVVSLAGEQLAGGEAEDGQDLEVLDRFPEALRREVPAKNSGEAGMAFDAVVRGLGAGGLRELLGFVDFGEGGKDGRIACGMAAELWNIFNGGGGLREVVVLGFKEEGGLAAGVIQCFSPGDSERFEMRIIFFKRLAEGWLGAPGLVSEEDREGHGELSEWVKGNEGEWRKTWKGMLFAASMRVGKGVFGGVIEDAAAEVVAGAWCDALWSGDLKAALGQAAWLGVEGDRPERLLRNLSQELAVARAERGELKKVYRAGSWVGVHVVLGVAGARRDCFLLVIVTEGGVKVLPEIDLLAGQGRTRAFLNNVAFEHLAAFVGAEKTRELKGLFEGFEREIGDLKSR